MALDTQNTLTSDIQYHFVYRTFGQKFGNSAFEMIFLRVTPLVENQLWFIHNGEDSGVFCNLRKPHLQPIFNGNEVYMAIKFEN